MKSPNFLKKKTSVFILLSLLSVPLYIYAQSTAQDKINQAFKNYENILKFYSANNWITNKELNDSSNGVLSLTQAAKSGAGAVKTSSYCEQLAEAPAQVTSFTRVLQKGMVGSDIFLLQQVLNSDSDTQVAQSGAGSPGYETNNFANLTYLAVQKFQRKYGIKPVNGIVSGATEAQMNNILATLPAGTIRTAPTITSVSPTSGTQGSTVIITGTGFVPTGNYVCSGSDTIASNLASSAHGTKLTFRLPSWGDSPKTWSFFVANKNGFGTASTDFAYEGAQVVPNIDYITIIDESGKEIEKQSGPPGTTVVLHGSGFDTTKTNRIVSATNNNLVASPDGDTLTFKIGDMPNFSHCLWCSTGSQTIQITVKTGSGAQSEDSVSFTLMNPDTNCSQAC